MKLEKQKLLAKAAYLYYIAGKKQAEIAAELKVDRTTVSRMLDKAKQSGIVEIKINQIDPTLFELETQLKNRFSLKQVEIAPTTQTDSLVQKELILAQSAADWLRRNVEPEMTIGLSWGATLGKMIEQVESKKIQGITTVPLVGGPSQIRSQYHVNTLVYELARKFQGESLFINAMVVQETSQGAKDILQANYFADLRAKWEQLDLALVGIGGPLSYQKSQWRDLITPDDLTDLKLREAVADCCCRFLDPAGKILGGSLAERTIGLSLAELKQVPSAVAIAQGKQKVPSILAVLKSHVINTLITDQETAEALLQVSN